MSGGTHSARPSGGQRRAAERVDFARAASVAAAIASREGRALLRGLRPRPARAKDASGDPVTAFDLAVERRILAALHRRFPDHALLAEETGRHGASSRFTWVVDPIDGTSNFAAGLPLFAVSIALLLDGRPVAAAAFSALERTTYRAIAGNGAFAGGRRLRGAATRDPGTLRVFGVQPARGERPFLPRIAREGGKVRRLGSAVLQHLAVARGAFDACFDERARVWDLAAATLIVREAGGVSVGLDRAPLPPFDLGDAAWPKPVPCISGSVAGAAALLDLVVPRTP